MSNLFQEVVSDAQGVQDRLLGPTYPYYKNIKSPSQIGMSDKGTIQQTAKNINGLIQYVQLFCLNSLSLQSLSQLINQSH